MAGTNLIPGILASVKKECGIPEYIDAFDSDLLMHINTVFVELNQLGVGPEEVFMIEGNDELWDDFSTDPKVNMARSYMYLEVRLMFDPPTASLLTALEKKRDELVWRINVACDKPFMTTDRTNQNGGE
ncbi:MAG: hypothetical protein IKG04_08870 [Exiguobacterium sp.]|nr:hypothetical protein [Exiguobacterium sp.]